MAARYAIYFAPAADSELWRFGASWLGRDAYTNQSLTQPPVPGFSPDELAAYTETPRRYGFHATLKAPFHLAADRSLDELDAQLRDFCARRQPVELSGLVLDRIDQFLALAPQDRSPALERLAQACVEAFEPFRAPLDADQLQRQRDKHSLSARQEDNLQRWGYPYVGEDFRFHMTLTGSLDIVSLERVHGVLEPFTAFLGHSPQPIDGIALFEQPGPGADFTVRRRYALAGAAARSA